MTYPPVKLSRVPNRSFVIWWQTEHDTPSAARRASSASTLPTGRCAKTWPLRPRAIASVRAIGMWQIEHSSWMSSVASG